MSREEQISQMVVCIKERYAKAIERGCTIGVFHYINEEIKKLGFPIGYIENYDSDCFERVLFAYLTEENKITFIGYTF